MKFSEILFSILMICLATVSVVCMSIAEEADVKTIRAVRIESDEAPAIDGKLDDECWKKAGKIGDFIQSEPVPGAKPRDPTDVYVIFDREKLYVGFECFKQNPDQILGSAMERDSHFFHALLQCARELIDAGFDALRSDGVMKVDGRAHGGYAGVIALTQGLEFSRPLEGRFSAAAPTRCHHTRPDLRDTVFFHIQHTGFLGADEPLV